MKIAIINNDFRVYWKDRLSYLQNFLAEKDIDFIAVELFGRGSPYSFDIYDNKETWWRCLFPNKSSTELSKEEIKKALFSTLNEINPAIIIAPSIVFFAGALSISWCKKNKKKFIMFDDAKPFQVKRNFLVQLIKNLIIEQSDGLWLPSNEYYKEYSYLHNKDITFFYGYNCINNQLFKFDGERKFNQNTIICVARLVSIKNINNLLWAWQIIEKKDINYKLIIIGNGPDYDSLVQLSTFLSLKRVHFLGTIDNSNLPVYFFNSDGFILPSLSETWGLVVNEAMAAGLPVLLSNKINSCQSILHEGVNGISFNPLNIMEMAEAIFKYISLDIEAKKAMSSESLNIINSMDYENMGLRLVDALVKITAKEFKKPGAIAALIINRWYGRYNTSGWDKL